MKNTQSSICPTADVDAPVTPVPTTASSSQVYCGLTSQGQLIAVKQVSLDSSDPDAAKTEYIRLQGEVELLKTLRHTNIVGFLGTSLQQHVVSIFMEYIPGGSIASILHRLVIHKSQPPTSYPGMCCKNNLGIFPPKMYIKGNLSCYI